MEYEIDESNHKYIKITVSGTVDKAGLLSVILDVLKLPNFASKHSLYDFSEASSGISLVGLKEIIEILLLHKPHDEPFSKKCAIVVFGQTHRAIADHFIQISKSLPVEYAAFNSIKEAGVFLESELKATK